MFPTPGRCGKCGKEIMMGCVRPALCTSCAGRIWASSVVMKTVKERENDMSESQAYWDLMNSIMTEDRRVLQEKGESYGESWKKRGGVGAFMMLARKWDRIEIQVSKKMIAKDQNIGSIAYDIFEHIEQDTKPEGILDDIRDLRRYLLLVETEMSSRDKKRITVVKAGRPD